jgi:hypothetical protein
MVAASLVVTDEVFAAWDRVTRNLWAICRVMESGGWRVKMVSLWKVNAFLSVAALGMFYTAEPQADELLGFISGNKLLAMCQSTSDMDKMNCVGYVTGFADSASKFAELGKTCYFQAEKGVTQKQLVDVTVKYLNDHPEERHWLAVTPMMEAMKTAFPCAK